MAGRANAARAVATACRWVDRIAGRDEVPIVVLVDVEPDARSILDPRDPGAWEGFERLVERLPALRERLAVATGAPAAFTWGLRMDPQIAQAWGSPAWVADAYASALAGLQREGDELGLHTHDWRWDDALGEWVIDHSDPPWAEHCLTTGLDAFEGAFGRRCATHRGGDHFLSGGMLARLQDGGIRVDLTVEPGLPSQSTSFPGERMRGRTPDYRGVPPGPYRSSPDAFPRPDPTSDADPVLLPLASAPGRHGRRPLVLWRQPERFAARLSIELLGRQPLLLGFSLRTSAAVGQEWDAVVANLEHVARHPGMRFMTASAVADRLAERTHRDPATGELVLDGVR